MHHGLVLLDILIHGLYWDRRHQGEIHRWHQIAGRSRGRKIVQLPCPQLSYGPMPGKAASFLHKEIKPVYFMQCFKSTVLLNWKGYNTALSEITCFSLSFVLMSQAGRCRSYTFRWWSRPQETPSFSRLEIINVSITCLIRWLKSPTKHVSRDANCEKEDSSELECLFLFCLGLFWFCLSRRTWLLFLC